MPMPVPCLGVGPRRRKEEAKRLKEAHESHWALLVVVSAVTKKCPNYIKLSCSIIFSVFSPLKPPYKLWPTASRTHPRTTWGAGCRAGISLRTAQRSWEEARDRTWEGGQARAGRQGNLVLLVVVVRRPALDGRWEIQGSKVERWRYHRYHHVSPKIPQGLEVVF